jgi:hypothetical protein
MPGGIEQLIASLDGELSPIWDVAMRHLARNGIIHPKSGAALLDHRPKYAPEAAICPFSLKHFARYLSYIEMQLSVPPKVRKTL